MAVVLEDIMSGKPIPGVDKPKTEKKEPEKKEEEKQETPAPPKVEPAPAPQPD